MNITVQGKRAFANYDIFAEVGKNVAQLKTVSGITVNTPASHTGELECDYDAFSPRV